mmetsp:Transcript_1206/g.3378  ORF Transcript_1206/g.3378 Transcript_1206/m.3378 type:complete len:80 (-) Transcript_1206:114-353(-)
MKVFGGWGSPRKECLGILAIQRVISRVSTTRRQEQGKKSPTTNDLERTKSFVPWKVTVASYFIRSKRIRIEVCRKTRVS